MLAFVQHDLVERFWKFAVNDRFWSRGPGKRNCIVGLDVAAQRSGQDEKISMNRTGQSRRIGRIPKLVFPENSAFCGIILECRQVRFEQVRIEVGDGKTRDNQ